MSLVNHSSSRRDWSGGFPGDANDELFKSPDVLVSAIVRQLAQTNPELRIYAEEADESRRGKREAEDSVVWWGNGWLGVE